MKDSYILIGHTKKTHGAQGEIKVEIKDQFLEDFIQAEVIFISIQGKPVPFFIENIRDAGDLLLKVEEIDTPAGAKEITSKELFLREADLLEDVETEMPSATFAGCTGFLLEDEELGPVGEVLEVVEYPHQEMAVVRYQEREILIPLHKDLIKHLDKKSRKLIMKLPDGMLDL